MIKSEEIYLVISTTVTYIQENPYVQYYLGLPEFTEKPLFDPSMMVHSRKRFPVEFVAEVNEFICTGKWPEDKQPVDRNDDNDDNDNNSNSSGGESNTDNGAVESENKGTLIMDATVAPADIKFPTDIDILNREGNAPSEADNGSSAKGNKSFDDVTNFILSDDSDQ